LFGGDDRRRFRPHRAAKTATVQTFQIFYGFVLQGCGFDFSWWVY
jgi:hypothetical protein